MDGVGRVSVAVNADQEALLAQPSELCGCILHPDALAEAEGELVKDRDPSQKADGAVFVPAEDLLGQIVEQALVAARQAEPVGPSLAVTSTERLQQQSGERRP